MYIYIYIWGKTGKIPLPCFSCLTYAYLSVLHEECLFLVQTISRRLFGALGSTIPMTISILKRHSPWWFPPRPEDSMTQLQFSRHTLHRAVCFGWQNVYHGLRTAPGVEVLHGDGSQWRWVQSYETIWSLVPLNQSVHLCWSILHILETWVNFDYPNMIWLCPHGSWEFKGVVWWWIECHQETWGFSRVRLLLICHGKWPHSAQGLWYSSRANFHGDVKLPHGNHLCPPMLCSPPHPKIAKSVSIIPMITFFTWNTVVCFILSTMHMKICLCNYM